MLARVRSPSSMAAVINVSAMMPSIQPVVYWSEMLRSGRRAVISATIVSISGIPGVAHGA